MTLYHCTGSLLPIRAHCPLNDFPCLCSHACELSDNRAARVALAAFAAAGGVVYVECGGLMYLSKSLQPPGEPMDLPMGKCCCLAEGVGGSTTNPLMYPGTAS